VCLFCRFAPFSQFDAAPSRAAFFAHLIFQKFDVPQILFVLFHRFVQSRRPIAQIRQIVALFSPGNDFTNLLLSL